MSATMKIYRTKHTRSTRRVVEGVLYACQHRIEWWYEVTGMRMITGDEEEQMEEEAEERARELIAEDYLSGELCCFLLGREEEVRGWWNIVRD